MWGMVCLVMLFINSFIVTITAYSWTYTPSRLTSGLPLAIGLLMALYYNLQYWYIVIWWGQHLHGSHSSIHRSFVKNARGTTEARLIPCMHAPHNGHHNIAVLLTPPLPPRPSSTADSSPRERGCQENRHHVGELTSWSGAESEGVPGESPPRKRADLVVWC